MKLKSDKLNIGSGQFKKEGYINLDVNPLLNPDVEHSLNKFPYPFDKETFFLVEADHVLEHVEEPFKTMGEIHRILKPGGKVIIKVPHFSRGFTNADHKRGFDVTFPYYFNPVLKQGFVGMEFDCKILKLKWFAQPYLKKQFMPALLFSLAVLLGGIIDFLANRSPFLCSRIWCFWVGGFEEIEFHLVKKD